MSVGLYSGVSIHSTTYYCTITYISDDIITSDVMMMYYHIYR